MCGADTARNRVSQAWKGSPPRVRSRHEPGRARQLAIGITSACAEQTVPGSCVSRICRDHLRVCGADGTMSVTQAARHGSPPRVRSRHGLEVQSHADGGITSACAEQTHPSQYSPNVMRDHLRVCGADRSFSFTDVDRLGSPPRVRSRRLPCGLMHLCRGITSACAEQTTPGSAKVSVTWDHLRVCGADMVAISLGVTVRGSPPRVRSRRRSHRLCERWPGITSACAEQTTGISCPCRVDRDHLRVCGADHRLGLITARNGGSPPRVRSRPRTPRPTP